MKPQPCLVLFIRAYSSWLFELNFKSLRTTLTRLYFCWWEIIYLELDINNYHPCHAPLWPFCVFVILVPLSSCTNLENRLLAIRPCFSCFWYTPWMLNSRSPLLSFGIQRISAVYFWLLSTVSLDFPFFWKTSSFVVYNVHLWTEPHHGCLKSAFHLWWNCTVFTVI